VTRRSAHGRIGLVVVTMAGLAVAASVALASCARADPVKAVPEADLVVFSSHPDELAKTIIDEFRERTGLRVRLVLDGTGALLSRLSAGERADVLWGGGAESLVANLGLFQPYLSPERDAVPAALKDEDGYWTGLTVLPMVIMVNARLVPPEAVPAGWSDLLAPELAGGVAFANPVSSASSYTILRTMMVAARARAGGDQDADWRFVEGFIDAIGGSTLSESAMVYRVVAAGEYLVGLTYENAGAESMRLGSDVRIVYPADGTSTVPDGVAILRDAAHDEAARRFIDFVLGHDVASVVSTRFKRRSARVDVPAPDGLPPLESVRLLDYDFDAAVTEREATMARFTTMLQEAGQRR